MAVNTTKHLRNLVMYQIYVRNFSEEGTFAAVKDKLSDIKALGTDIIWFAPIHPIGVVKREGTLGSPYAISDYRAVNPEYGSLDDFKDLVNAIHEYGMKCMIDVVYNHTSPDSVLSKEHPEWFYHKDDGEFGNRVGDWSDIIDLDYSHMDLWDYQIETLKYWAEIVDGFRCDVASLIPIEFWKKAREAVEAVRPGCIWLSESVHPEFIVAMRDQGYTALSDSEIYQAFDIAYDYDIYENFADAVKGNAGLEQYTMLINRQEFTYPDNYVKLRFLENHDMPRIRSYVADEKALRNWTAFNYFQKGLTLVYNGQEIGAYHLPGLFDKDPINWNADDRIDLSGLMRKLAEIKKDPLFADSTYHVEVLSDGVIMASHRRGGKMILGIFSTNGKPVNIQFPYDQAKGKLTNLITGSDISISQGVLHCDGEPVILKLI